jgi:DNA-binding NarL/FixJ family response regulator
LAYRVLVVDDYEPWRLHIEAAIRAQPHWELAGDAGDGLDAIAMARALEPDLILLDVGLPGVNGIEAARQILAFLPAVPILFMSEHRSWDIVQAAMRVGGRGYIVKAEIGPDLVSAMDAVVRGRRFVSAGPLKQVFAKAAHERKNPRPRCHEAALYPDEAALVDDYGRFAAAALAAGEGAVVVTTSGRLEAIAERLRARGVDVDGALREGRYLPADLDQTVAAFTSNDRIDEQLFRVVATGLLLQTAGAAVSERPRVAAMGDAAAMVLHAGGLEEAMRVERLWNELADTYHIDVLCGYLSPASAGEEYHAAIQHLCTQHTAIRERQAS